MWLRMPPTALQHWREAHLVYSRRCYTTSCHHRRSYSTTSQDAAPTPTELQGRFKNLEINRILILEKVTKYDLERRNGLSDADIRDRFPRMFCSMQCYIPAVAYRTHRTHTKIMDAIRHHLRDTYQIDYKVIKAQSHNLTLDDLERSNFPPDLIISAGGDGTFLEAAALVPPSNNTKRHLFVVGINTDPERSVGALCLSYFRRGNSMSHFLDKNQPGCTQSILDMPKQNMIRFTETGSLMRKECTSDTTGEKEWADISSATFCGTQQGIPDKPEGHCTVISKRTANIYNLTYDEYVGTLLERLLVKRDYKPIARQRIRIKMFKRGDCGPSCIEHSKVDAAGIEDTLFSGSDSTFSNEELGHPCGQPSGILPYGAVNDVIIADESFGRTFYGLVQVDSSSIMRFKSSGVLISTGTGSTAWAYNMCKMSMNHGMRLLESLLTHPSFPREAAGKVDAQMMREVVEAHNAKLVFGASQNTLKCIIREAIYDASTVDASTFMGKQVKILSLSKNARMFVDGSKVVNLDYGDVVVLKTFNSDTIWSCI
ncbi:DNA-directed RNA polymerase III RPC8 [Babesia ovis]|uniref:DNA-directed RNA polymerase III RPC8 n=1 Tax=Babesia ovis TaxID=5869 RepID=A0A9W5TDU9_BABOV|nr:DNA-directed RNA polymerase III RPC8 [Babesia ovis]